MFGVTRRDEEFYLIQSLKTREKTTKKRNKIQVWRSHVKGKGRQALFLFDLPSLDAAVLHLLSPLARSLLPLSSLSLSLFSVSRVGTRFSNERTFVHPMFHMFLFKRSNRNFQKNGKSELSPKHVLARVLASVYTSGAMVAQGGGLFLKKRGMITIYS